MSTEDAVTFGILRAVAYLFAIGIVVSITFALLKFLSRHFWAVAGVVAIIGGIMWVIAKEPFGAVNSEYLIAVPLLGLMALGVLAWFYELLVKMEKRWDRALEARRYRKMQSAPPWGPRPPQQ
jgi:hypothetical protein